MNRQDLIAELEAYRPYNEQEAAEAAVILRALREQDDVFLRSNLVNHMTASAWVMNEARTKVLMAYHNIYHSWAWLGGHADGDEDLLAVALKETREESGLTRVRPADGKILSVEIVTVNGHEKRGKYVPSHLHLNVTYLILADETEKTRVKADENSGVMWFDREEALERSTEPWIVERIYKKLNEKAALI